MYESLFAPRIRNTLVRRLAWIRAQFATDTIAILDSVELTRELGHPMSQHGIALRRLLKCVAQDGVHKIYEIDKDEWKAMLAELNELGTKHAIDTVFDTNLQRQHIDLVLRVSAAEERIESLVKAVEPASAEEYYRAMADAGLLSNALKGVRSAIATNKTQGRAAAELELDRWMNVKLSSGEPLLTRDTTTQISYEVQA